MSQKKRHLSHQQQRNMLKNREQKVKKLSAQQQLLDDISAQSENPELTLNQGIVISRYGKRADVMPYAQEIFNHDYCTCYMKAALEDLVVGDKVFYVEVDQEHNFIVQCQPRTNMLKRYYFNRERNVVANVQTMIITSSIQPVLNTEIIDRYLVAAFNSSITPLIVINKIDLCSPQDLEQVQQIASTYQQLGVTTLLVSTTTGQNMDSILPLLGNGMHILVGQTGVGKSSIINKLIGQEQQVVGEISQETLLGKHTTTSSRLLKIDDHRAIIDSPGIREFSIENYSNEEIMRGYPELNEPGYQCKFSDCTHQNNLGCGIERLFADNKISEFRYQNLLNLLLHKDLKK